MISVEGLSKYYGERAAIRELTFQIASGEIVGFLGLNGAGKSTTLRILSCVLMPTEGSVTIDGLNLAEAPHEIRKRIGFLPDAPPLYDDMRVCDYLRFAAALRGVEDARMRAAVDHAVSRTGIGDYRNVRIAHLSHGFRQRVGIAQALVHRPKLVILDEPTGGLDPVQIKEMREFIRGLKGEHTVLVSSHMLSEVSQICDRCLIIHQGTLLAQGSEQQLAAELGGATAFQLELATNSDAWIAAIASVPGVTVTERTPLSDGGVTLVCASDGDSRPAVVRALVAAGADLLRLDRSAARLESVFVALTTGKREERS